MLLLNVGLNDLDNKSVAEVCSKYEEAVKVLTNKFKFVEVSHQFQNFQQLDTKEKYAFRMVQEDVQTEKLCCWIKNATEKRKTFLGIL